MDGISLKSIIVGFLAGALAYVTAHEAVKYLLLDSGLLSGVSDAWSMQPAASTGFPTLLMDAAWGGLWGIVFALILGNAPQGSMTLRGLVLGLLGPAAVGIFILPPLLAGQSPLDATRDIHYVAGILLLGAVFGAVTAWLYGLLSYGRLP